MIDSFLVLDPNTKLLYFFTFFYAVLYIGSHIAIYVTLIQEIRRPTSE